jgi:hypothetical protein
MAGLLRASRRRRSRDKAGKSGQDARMNAREQLEAEIRSAALGRSRQALVELVHTRGQGLTVRALIRLLVSHGQDELTLGELCSGRASGPERTPAKPARVDDQASVDVMEAVMTVLRGARRPLGVREIATKLGVHMATVRRAVRRLGERVTATGDGWEGRYSVNKAALEPAASPRVRTRQIYYLNM